MTRYRLSTHQGEVLHEWSTDDRRSAEGQAVNLVAEHRGDDPPGDAEYVLAEERSGDWKTVVHWGRLAP